MSEPSSRSTTPRGFFIYTQLTDTYGNEVRVQESSAATQACVWVFANSDRDGLTARDRAHLAAAGFTSDLALAELAAKLTPSPHLNVAQARHVRDALDAFISENEGDARD